MSHALGSSSIGLPQPPAAELSTASNLPVPSTRGDNSQKDDSGASIMSTSRSSSHRPTSTLASSVVSAADIGSNSTSTASFSNKKTSFTSLTSGASTQVELPFGPLPEWAYFYNPPLSLSQVEYVQSRMKSAEEYRRMVPSNRHNAMIKDLSEALFSMRQNYSRSTDVLSPGVIGTRGVASPSVQGTPTLLAQEARHGSTTKNPITIVLSSDDSDETSDVDRTILDLDEPDDAAHMDSIVPPEAPPLPSGHRNLGYDLAKLNGNDTHGKRAADDDGSQQRKRHKTTDNDDGDHQVTNDAASNSSKLAQNPESANQSAITRNQMNQIIENAQKRWLDLAGPSFSSDQHEVVPTGDGRRKIVIKRSGIIRWYEEELELLMQLKSEGKGWDQICEILPRHSRAAIRTKYHVLLKDKPESPVNRETPKLGNDVSSHVRWTKEEEEELLRARAGGRTWEEVQKKLPHYSVDSIRRKHGHLQQRTATSSFQRLRSSLRNEDATHGEETRRQRQDTTAVPANAKIQSELTEMVERQGRLKKMLGTTQQHKVDITSPAAPRTDTSPLPANSLGVVSVPWSRDELDLVIKSRAEDKPWDEIHEALPRHTEAAIRQKYYNLKKAGKTALVSRTPQRVERDSPVQHVDEKHGRVAVRGTAKRSSELKRNPGRQAKTRRPEGFSADLTGRPYHVFEDKSGRTETAHGLLLPRDYASAKAVGTGVPWVCPIRSCRYQFKRMSSLGKHWKRNHRNCLLNDNNDGTFSLRGEYQPKKVKSANALIISRDPPDPNELPMAEARSFRQEQLANKDDRDPTSDGRGKSGLTKTAGQEPSAGSQPVLRQNFVEDSAIVNSVHVTPSPDPTMATKLRAYNEWPNPNGKLSGTRGTLLPLNYRLTDFRGFEWICPVRSCRRVVQSMPALGGHFTATHFASLLNDNGDGTFTEVGRYNFGQAPTGKGHHRRAMVKSKIPLGDNAPPMAEPKVAWCAALRVDAFEASRAECERVQSERRHQHRPVLRSKTVDEIMAEGGGEDALKNMLAKGQLVDDSESSELSNLDSIPDSELAMSESEASTSPELPKQLGASNPEEDEQMSKANDGNGLTHPVERENWKIIQGLFTSKVFPPPQSGPLKELLRLPRRREIELRNTQKFSVFWPKDVSLLIAQLVSKEAPKPCDRCENGGGMFKGCIMLSQEVANVLQGGVCSCVNCGWKSAHFRVCNLKQVGLRSTMARGPKPSRAKTTLGSKTQPNTAVRHVDVSTGDELSPLRARRSERLLTTNNVTRNDEQTPIMGSQGRAPRKVAMPRAPPVQTLVGAAEVGVTKTANAAENVETRAMSHFAKVDDRFAVSIDVIPNGAADRFEPDLNNLRICTLASGKLVVQMQGEPAFTIGFQGMFTIVPGATCEVLNTSGIDAVLRVSSLRTGR